MKKRSLKLGDMIAALTKTLHIPHCEKCEKRRLILNEVRKLGIRETMRRLKAAGVVEVGDGNERPVEALIKELNDCCGK
jgi:hypothetical protein